MTASDRILTRAEVEELRTISNLPPQLRRFLTVSRLAVSVEHIERKGVGRESL